MRFFSRRTLLGLLAVIILLLAALSAGLFFYLTSPSFKERARLYILEQIEKRTGGTASLESLDWDLWDQRIHLENLTLRGLEPPTEAPLAHFDTIDIGIKIRSLFDRRIDLFELILTKPDFHMIVGADGRTNFPSPPQTGPSPSLDFEISIENFRIVDGTALVNERELEIDLALRNLNGDFQYRGTSGILSGRVNYDGTIEREGRPAIPYSLDATLDLTRGTLMTHQVTVKSGESELHVQGRINDVFTRNIAGKLEYSGTLNVPFLNYFLENEKLSGKADLTGFMEFAKGYFFTKGNATASAIDYEGWNATRLKTEFSYHFPERRATLRYLRTGIVGGNASGDIVIEHLPGLSRVDVDIDYAGIQGAALARVYPWDPKYRIFSRMSGRLSGWFEGKLERYSFTGDASFKPYTPTNIAGVIPLPLDGFTEFSLVPGQVQVSNTALRLGSTEINAEGLIHENASNLKLALTSGRLDDLSFLYKDANGSGTFDGTLSGPMKTPALAGSFTLQNHSYKTYKIDEAAGDVRLDTRTEVVELTDTRVKIGQSEVIITGSAALSGTPADFRIAATRVTGADLTSFINRPVGGQFSGNLHVTSLDPFRVEGDVQATGLELENRLVGDVRARVQYFAPAVEVTQLSIRNGAATLVGDASFDRDKQEVKFSTRVNSVDFEMLRWLGIPESLRGVIQQADIRGDGTTSRPNIRGNAVIQNLAIDGEVFKEARVELESTGTNLNLSVHTDRNLELTAQIDTGTKGYPFTAKVAFTRYPMEHLARLSEGTFTLTGDASVSGLLTDKSRLNGRGQIQSVEAVIRERTLSVDKPFTFSFNSERLTLSNVTLAGDSTQISIGGTIGFTESEGLGLDVSGRLDLALLAGAAPDWTSSGQLVVEGRIRGTPQKPDLRGLAHFTDASLGRRGFFTTLSGMNGDLFFDQNRVTVNNLEGRVGGGTVKIQGTALLENQQVGGMNIRIESNNVRIRYPEGLRTVVNGTLVLRGDQASPILEGNLQIQSMTYRTSFEQFLAMFQGSGDRLQGETTALGRLRLSIHIEGSRNISIQNEVADVEARVDLDVRGTVNEPAVTGHVEASGGTLIFQGTRYEVTRGNVDFVDPVRIEPVIDLQAETELRDYRVILAVSGRGDRMRLDLRSDPPLPQLEVVSLIAGGRTREELASQPGATGVPTSEQLFQRGAGSILFDLLQSRVGSRFGLLGLDRVRIDPFLVSAANDPVARITVSEQLTKDLAITYAQDLTSSRQQIIIIEYFVTKDTSIVASKDETGALGLDLRWRRRFK